jgi:HK97 gp10 family phage protein
VSDQSILGGRELDAFLQTLPVKVEKNIMRAALRAGAGVFRDEARKKLQENGSVISGLLMRGLRTSSRAQQGEVTANVKVGGKHRHIAQWVEYGTAAHRIKAKGAKALHIHGEFAAGVVHLGAKEKPFMRPAFDQRAGDAVEAVGVKVRERLTAEGLDTPAQEGE